MINIIDLKPNYVSQAPSVQLQIPAYIGVSGEALSVNTVSDDSFVY
jgi:hypothetical protein